MYITILLKVISGLVLRGDFILPIVLIYVSISCIALISRVVAHTLDLLLSFFFVADLLFLLKNKLCFTAV
jgi:hypothetical protein